MNGIFRFFRSQTAENVAGRSGDMSYTSGVVQDAWELKKKDSNVDFEKKTISFVTLPDVIDIPLTLAVALPLTSFVFPQQAAVDSSA